MDNNVTDISALNSEIREIAKSYDIDLSGDDVVNLAICTLHLIMVTPYLPESERLRINMYNMMDNPELTKTYLSNTLTAISESGGFNE